MSPEPPAPALPSAASAPRARWLGLAALALFIGLALQGPIKQWDNYHAFADTRAWLGVPHAADVLSNVLFLIVGGFGLWRLSNSALAWPSRKAWQWFCAAILCTSAGSAFYHWAPNNTALVFDRIPIAWACAALTCALLAEHVHRRWADASVLAAGWLIATAAVVYWWATDLRGLGGLGDLRPYLYVQTLPMLLVPLVLLLRLPAVQSEATPAGAWWSVLGLYAAAKAMEAADHAVLAATGFISGHTLKHLLAAAAAAWIVRAVTRERRGA